MDPRRKIYRIRPVTPSAGEGNFWWFGWDGEIDEWKLHGHSHYIEEHTPSPSGSIGTSLHLKFHISRIPDFYFIKVILPLLALWQMQFWTFFLSPAAYRDRMEHLSTLLLTTCAFVYVIQSYLPKLAFLTMIDRTVMLLFLSITINGWLQIMYSLLGNFESVTSITFKWTWIFTNIFCFVYFQFYHYWIPYRRLCEARRGLDAGKYAVTNTDSNFEYSILTIDREVRKIEGGHSSRRKSQQVGPSPWGMSFHL